LPSTISLVMRLCPDPIRPMRRSACIFETHL
jgi:hypothetical protein